MKEVERTPECWICRAPLVQFVKVFFYGDSGWYPQDGSKTIISLCRNPACIISHRGKLPTWRQKGSVLTHANPKISKPFHHGK
jgi:hypothetical protein